MVEHIPQHNERLTNKKIFSGLKEKVIKSLTDLNHKQEQKRNYDECVPESAPFLITNNKLSINLNSSIDHKSQIKNRIGELHSELYKNIDTSTGETIVNIDFNSKKTLSNWQIIEKRPFSLLLLANYDMQSKEKTFHTLTQDEKYILFSDLRRIFDHNSYRANESETLLFTIDTLKNEYKKKNEHEEDGNVLQSRKDSNIKAYLSKFPKPLELLKPSEKVERLNSFTINYLISAFHRYYDILPPQLK